MMKRRIFTPADDLSILSGYRAGEDLGKISQRMDTSRSTIYRRLGELDEPAREPRKRAHNQNRCRIIVYSQAHPLVKELLKSARWHWYSMTELAKRTGLTRETINGWNRGKQNITLQNLEKLGHVLRKRLVWISTEGPGQQEQQF